MTDSIVYLSRVLWDSIYQRPQHLAAGLAQTMRVLYVDTPRSTFYRRFLRPLAAGRPVRPLLWQPEPNLTVLSPAYVPFLPGWWPPPGQYTLSRLILRWASRRLGVVSPIVWTADPRDMSFLDTLAPRLVCYDCMDDYSLIAPSAKARPRLREQEIAILRRADVVFASSHELAERCGKVNTRVVLVPNGVEAEHFSAPAPIAADLVGVPSPRIGYIGSLAPWLDVDLLSAVAQKHPEWSVILVGPIVHGAEKAIAELRRLSNVHILGERSYQAIPLYLHGFDVALIPFRLNDLTRVVNPVKYYEYMAAGRPVVATPLPELLPYADVCTLAAEAPSFIAGIEKALAEGSTPARVQQRLAVAQANTWAQRTEAVRNALLAALGESG